MVVQGHVAQQRLLQVLAAAEPVGFENIGNAAVEALDHSVGSGRSRLGQPVFNPQRLAKLVKLMAATGLALSGCKEPVRELLAVVGQQLVDFDRAGLVQGLKKRAALAALLSFLIATNRVFSWSGEGSNAS